MNRYIEEKKRTLDDFGVDYSNIDFSKFQKQFDLDIFCRKLINDAIDDPYNKRYNEPTKTEHDCYYQRDKILYWHEQGLTTLEICNKLYLNPSTIYSVLSRLGLKSNRRQDEFSNQ